MKALAGFGAGFVFGIGLLLGGMTDPARVLGFLDVFGHWDPTLAFVMAGAVAVSAIGYRLVLARSRPWLAPTFHLPTARDLDRRLVAGAAIFGVGWGLAGYCPGPAIVSAAAGDPGVLLLLACMVLGWGVAERMPARPAPVREAAQ
ncbi:MAG: YeeE/YedE family protein [Rudaea sp.]